MLFNSVQFLLFFPIVVAVYFALPFRFRWVFLLGASYYFYMCWRPAYALVLVVLTAIDYTAGVLISGEPNRRRRKKLLWISLTANLGLLFFFKYFNFFNRSVQAVCEQLGLGYAVPAVTLVLPIGISFHTFQTMSYAIDVYRGQMKAERHLGIYALFVVFFPQLVAGPIERSQHLLHQFYEKHVFEYQRVTDGLKLMLWGFCKKVVVADRLAPFVNEAYNHPHAYSGLPLVLASYFFAFQIYCDFSGYSDIAKGAAQVLGFDLMTNFRRPYFATSVSDFWHRWHISLSTWFRDYLYIPLGGNRVEKRRWYFNLFFVFLVSGFWHGANWTYLVWGALHGFYLLFALWTKPLRQSLWKLVGLEEWSRLQRVARMLVTFHLVLFAWIFFRANSIQEAFYIATHLFARPDLDGLLQYIYKLDSGEFLLSLMAIPGLGLIEVMQERMRIREFLSTQPLWLRWTAYYVGVMVILCVGKFTTQQFIYFQF